jgi:hypothetical protein
VDCVVVSLIVYRCQRLLLAQGGPVAVAGVHPHTLTPRSRNQKVVHYHDGALDQKIPFGASLNSLFAAR